MRRAALLLAAAVLAVYWPVLGGAFVYDDEPVIVTNPALRSGDVLALVGRPYFGAEEGYWRPLTSLLQALGHWLGGAAGIHAIALAVHAAAAMVALALAQRLCGDRRVAVAAAILFALHPVHTEGVAWCAALNDPLAGLCVLTALLAVVRGKTITACVAFAVGLLAKESALVALPLLIAADAWMRRQPMATSCTRVLLTGLGLVLALWWTARAFVFGDVFAGFDRAMADPTLVSDRAWSGPMELLLRELALLAWPWPLTPFRALAPTWPMLACAAIAVTALVALAAFAFRRQRALTLLLLTIVAAPVLFVTVRFAHLGGYPIADRYLYVPVFGVALLVAMTLGARTTLVLAGLTGALAFTQTWVWHSPATLVQHGLSLSPDDPNLHVMAGNQALAAAQAGDARQLQAAEQSFAHAIALLASDPDPRGVPRARGQALLGSAWCLFVKREGRADATVVEAFRRALDADIRAVAAWVGYGVANGAAGRINDAEDAFLHALDLSPQHSEAHYNLGYLYLQTARPLQARGEFLAALRSDPGNVQARQQLQRMR